jgi:hypothetical protein
MRLLLVSALAIVGLLAAGCGGSKSPSVASLGPSTTTTGSGGSPPSSSSLPKGAAADFVKFVDCMQKHGIQAQLGQGGRGVSISGVDPGSSQLQTAQKACQKLLPNGGPQPLTPAQEAQNLKGLLALATCMRTHGFPSFPDPNGQGVFNLQGVDPSSSQFQSAMTACQPKGKSQLRISIRAASKAGP